MAFNNVIRFFLIPFIIIFILMVAELGPVFLALSIFVNGMEPGLQCGK